MDHSCHCGPGYVCYMCTQPFETERTSSEPRPDPRTVEVPKRLRRIHQFVSHAAALLL